MDQQRRVQLIRELDANEDDLAAAIRRKPELLDVVNDYVLICHSIAYAIGKGASLTPDELFEREVARRYHSGAQG